VERALDAHLELGSRNRPLEEPPYPPEKYLPLSMFMKRDAQQD